MDRMSVTKHEIELTPSDPRPIHSAPHRAYPRRRALERDEVFKTVKQGVAQHVTSEWASPVVFMSNKDGNQLFCVDYCRLDQITVMDSYCISRLDNVVDSLRKAQVFSTPDTNAGYRQT